MSVVGTPDDDFLSKIQSEDARSYIRNLPKMPPKDFRKLFPNASPAAVDLLEKTLSLDPDNRLVSALLHSKKYLPLTQLMKFTSKSKLETS